MRGTLLLFVVRAQMRPSLFCTVLVVFLLVDRDVVPVFLARQLVCFLEYRD